MTSWQWWKSLRYWPKITIPRMSCWKRIHTWYTSRQGVFLFSRQRYSSWSPASCCLLTLSLSSWVRLAGFLGRNLSFFGWPLENPPWGWDIVPQVSSWICTLFNSDSKGSDSPCFFLCLGDTKRIVLVGTDLDVVRSMYIYIWVFRPCHCIWMADNLS